MWGGGRLGPGPGFASWLLRLQLRRPAIVAGGCGVGFMRPVPQDTEYPSHGTSESETFRVTELPSQARGPEGPAARSPASDSEATRRPWPGRLSSPVLDPCVRLGNRCRPAPRRRGSGIPARGPAWVPKRAAMTGSMRTGWTACPHRRQAAVDSSVDCLSAQGFVKDRRFPQPSLPCGLEPGDGAAQVTDSNQVTVQHR